MPRTHFISFLFALIVAGNNLAHAQILANGDIELNCGAGSNPTFDATCLPPWAISHGSPQLITSGGIVGPSSLAMWSQKILFGPDLGEGVLAPLILPTPTGESYELCFYYRMVPGTNGDGNIVARFTTGLVEFPPSGLGGEVPTPTTELVVYNSPVVMGAWHHVVLTVSSLSAFSQLNIYPVASSFQTFWVEVDGFELNYCGTNLLATPATLPMPTGLHQRSGTITSSSLGGAGFVTADPGVPTAFRAGQYVLLEPNFVAMPNRFGCFLAEIETACGCSGSGKMSGGDLTSALAPYEIDVDEFDVALFPNPISETVTLNANAALEEVHVLDLSGKVLLERLVLDGLQVVKLDMTEFPSGVYLVESQSKSGGRVVTKLVKE
jgi:Secretion system C-terminal sorting domain